jgi:chemotaxis protein CheX
MSGPTLEPFLVALRQIFDETGIDITRVHEGPRAAQDQVVASVGLTGAFKGNLMICTDYLSAVRIIRCMMDGVNMEFPDGRITEIQSTALGEFTNQISGRAVTLLSHQGYACDITPPIVITAKKLESHLSGLQEFFTRVVEGPFGSLTMLIGLSLPHGL